MSANNINRQYPVKPVKAFFLKNCNTLVLRNKAKRAMGVSFQKPHMPASLYGTAV
jgi:hypothetical protein